MIELADIWNVTIYASVVDTDFSEELPTLGPAGL
jgi:hypothetical protein